MLLLLLLAPSGEHTCLNTEKLLQERVLSAV